MTTCFVISGGTPAFFAFRPIQSAKAGALTAPEGKLLLHLWIIRVRKLVIFFIYWKHLGKGPGSDLVGMAGDVDRLGGRCVLESGCE